MPSALFVTTFLLVLNLSVLIIGISILGYRSEIQGAGLVELKTLINAQTVDIADLTTLVEAQNFSCTCGGSGSTDVFNDTDPDCSDNRECTMDRRETTRNTCYYEPYGLSQACTSVCYNGDVQETLHCDGSGGCIGDASGCLGVCDMVGDNIFQEACGLSWHYIYPTVYGFTDVLSEGIDTYGVCYGDNCVGYYILWSGESVGSPVMAPFADDTFECLDFLDRTYHADQIDAGCLRTQKVPIGDFYIQNDGAIVGNFSAEVCLYRYNCGFMNGTVIDEYNALLKKRAVEDDRPLVIPTTRLSHFLNHGRLPARGSSAETVTLEAIRHISNHVENRTAHMKSRVRTPSRHPV